MKVLVSAATKHGATSGISETIAAVLTDRGLETTVVPPQVVVDVAGYDAVILGSAVYVGYWLEPATALVDRAHGALASRPVWVFSSRSGRRSGAQARREHGPRPHRVARGPCGDTRAGAPDVRRKT